MENGKSEMGQQKCTPADFRFPISHFPFPLFKCHRRLALKPSLDDTLALMRDLRKRCDWDAAQTHESLRPYLIEEAHEVDEALLAKDDARLREELGDLLLQILFHSVIAEERGAFTMHDVAETFVTKMK